MNPNPFLRWLQHNIAAILLFLIVLVGLTVMIHSVTAGNTLGADFYIYWNSGRAAIFDHLSPYDPNVALQTQFAILGHPAPPNEDQLAFAYPFYAIFILFPLLFLPFDWAQALWMSACFITIVSLGFVLSNKKTRWIILTAILFYPIAFSIILGNFNLLMGVMFLYIFGTLILKNDNSLTNQIISGILIGFSTIKPQFAWLFLVITFLFILYKKLWKTIIAAFITIAVLLLLSFVIEPKWINNWLSLIDAYAQYNKVQPMLTNILVKYFPLGTASLITGFGLFCSFLMGFILLIRWKNQKSSSVQVLAYFGFITYLFHPNGTSYEQITLLVPFILWAIHTFLTQRKAVAIFWWSYIIISWVAFFLTRFTNIYPPATYEIPILFNFIWLIWIFTFNWRKINAPN